MTKSTRLDFPDSGTCHDVLCCKQSQFRRTAQGKHVPHLWRCLTWADLSREFSTPNKANLIEEILWWLRPWGLLNPNSLWWWTAQNTWGWNFPFMSSLSSLKIALRVKGGDSSGEPCNLECPRNVQLKIHSFRIHEWCFKSAKEIFSLTLFDRNGLWRKDKQMRNRRKKPNCFYISNRQWFVRWKGQQSACWMRQREQSAQTQASTCASRTMPM